MEVPVYYRGLALEGHLGERGEGEGGRGEGQGEVRMSGYVCERVRVCGGGGRTERVRRNHFFLSIFLKDKMK